MAISSVNFLGDWRNMTRTTAVLLFVAAAPLLLWSNPAASQSSSEDLLQEELKKSKKEQDSYKSMPLPSPSRPSSGTGAGPSGDSRAYRNLQRFEEQLRLEKLDKLDQLKLGGPPPPSGHLHRAPHDRDRRRAN
jgi:hypothetical protein